MVNIGSLISLITNSEIRYEGFLCYLDAEDTSIGLQYVRSFGTEGRRKNGSQVPPSDTIYLYIYFHRRDIKAIIARSLPSVQTARLPDDPAIVQGYFPPPTYEPVNLSTSGTAQVTYTGYNPQSGVLAPSFDRNYSLHPTVENPGSWGSTYPQPTMPTTFASFTGFSGEASHIHQQHFPPPPKALLATRPFQQHADSSNSNARSVPISPSTIEPHNSLIRPITTPSQNRLPQVPPPWLFFSTVSGRTSVPPSSTTGSQIFTPPVHSSSSSANHYSLRPFPKPSLFTPPNLQPNIASDPPMMDLTSQVSPTQGTSMLQTATKQVTETKTSGPDLASQQSKLVLPLNPALVTDNGSLDKIPVQPSVTLLQKGRKELPSTRSLLIAKDDPKLNRVEASMEALLSKSGSVEEPPQQSVQPQATAPKEYGLSPNNSYGRGRDIMPSDAPIQANIGYGSQAKAREHGVERYSKEFDFEAMNKKFNKEEVWRSLTTSNMAIEVTTGGVQKLAKKHVNSEDGFFDTFLADTLDSQSGKGGEDLSEQRRIDNETFGEEHNDQERRDNQEPVRSGGSGGFPRGRGHVNTGRGRGRTV